MHSIAVCSRLQSVEYCYAKGATELISCLVNETTPRHETETIICLLTSVLYVFCVEMGVVIKFPVQLFISLAYQFSECNYNVRSV